MSSALPPRMDIAAPSGLMRPHFGCRGRDRGTRALTAEQLRPPVGARGRCLPADGSGAVYRQMSGNRNPRHSYYYLSIPIRVLLRRANDLRFGATWHPRINRERQARISFKA